MKTWMGNIRRIIAFAMALILLCASLDVSAVAVYAEEIAEEECSMTVSANGVVMTANDAYGLRQAIFSCLGNEDGECDMTIDLPADAGEELFAAIRSALVEYGNYEMGILVNLTISGAEAIPVGAFGVNYTEEGGEVVNQIGSICLPDALSIGESAFESCGNLTTVTASKLQTVGAYAFSYCALASVEMPEVTTIGQYAFSGCASLTSVALPKVTDIGGIVFWNCTHLERLELTSPDAIVMGDNVFSGAPTENIDLVLNRNKSGEIINGTTWNGYEFNSVCAGYKGDLRVNVAATGGNDSEEKAFTLQIKLSDTSINGKYGDVTFENGEASVVLKNGESKTAVGLPEDITYTVTEDNTSGYKATKSGDTGTIVKDECQTADFNFKYSASGSVKICARVVMQGAALEESFLTLELVDKNVDSETCGEVIATTKNGVSKSEEDENIVSYAIATVPALEYTHDDAGKEFQYEVRMLDEKKPGYTYDDMIHNIFVYVTDNGDGTLTVTAVDEGRNDVTVSTGENLEFECSYVASGEVDIEANVTLEGQALEEGQFSFQLRDSKDNVLQTKNNNADGTINFEPLTYDQDDAGKEFQYTIRMVDEENPEYTYDDTIHTISVYVTDNGDGTLTVEKDKITLDFECSYVASGEVDIEANVTLEGQAVEEGQFSFQLRDSKDNVLQTKNNNADGTINFEPLTYDQDDAGKTFTYYIKQVDLEEETILYDNVVKEIRVEVSDNKDGTLSVSVAGEAIFENIIVLQENEDGIYCLNNARHLLWFAQKVNEGQTAINAKLTADINLNGIDWTIMENFAGTFDGNGYTISELNGHKSYTPNTHGFIRTLANGGVVKNLIFTEADIFNHEGNGAISAVIVYTNNGTVENCVVKNSLIQHGNYDALGVVVGVNGGTIRNCASISNTMKRRHEGVNNKAACGFVWSNGTNATIENCMVYDCTYTDASANYAFTGINNGTITNCYYYESSETISDTVATAKTADQFASGEVAYLLNDGKTDGTQSWYQTLETDTYPVPDNTHGTVYYGYISCSENAQPEYSNQSDAQETKPDHVEGKDVFFTLDGEIVPTCTERGVGHTECEKCHKVMQTNVTVEASGHTGGTATCKNKAECSVCHEGYGELDKNNHAGETEVKDAKKATCAVDGYTGDTYCKDCGAKIATGTKIDKSTAHTWDNGVVTKEATATEKGEKTYTCKVCKATKKEAIAALGVPKKGAVAKSDKATYKVTKSDLKNGTAAYVGPLDKSATKVTIPATVKIDGVTFKVTSIEKNAFKNNKKVKTVTIGKNVTTIGAKAFYGCSKLKTLKIMTTKLTTKKIGSKAFSKTPKSMKVTVPKKKFKTYKSMLIKKGVNKKASFKKS